MDSYGVVIGKKKVNTEKFPDMLQDPVDIHVQEEKKSKAK